MLPESEQKAEQPLLLALGFDSFAKLHGDKLHGRTTRLCNHSDLSKIWRTSRWSHAKSSSTVEGPMGQFLRMSSHSGLPTAKRHLLLPMAFVALSGAEAAAGFFCTRRFFDNGGMTGTCRPNGGMTGTCPAHTSASTEPSGSNANITA